MENGNVKNKYLVIYLLVAYGLCWGLASIYIIFYDTLSKILGEMSFTNPGVMVSLYSPNIAGLIVLGLIGGRKAIKNVLKKIVPKKGTMHWFFIVLGLGIAYGIFVHFGSLICGFGAPEMTFGPKQMLIELLKNLFEEAGILGGVLGWIGFLLPFLQKKFNNNVKAGLMTGLLFGIYVLPGYAMSVFQLSAVYPLYIMQMMAACVFVSYMFNATEGNLLYYIILFWLIASGSRLQLYYFNSEVQLLQILYFIIVDIIVYFLAKNKRIKQEVQMLPEYIGM